MATSTEIRSIRSARTDLRIEEQRKGFETLAAAIERAGFRKAALEFRREADRAIDRAIAFKSERCAFESDRAALSDVRAVLDTVLPDAARDGRQLSDAERISWIIEEWKAVSLELSALSKAATA